MTKKTPFISNRVYSVKKLESEFKDFSLDKETSTFVISLNNLEVPQIGLTSVDIIFNFFDDFAVLSYIKPTDLRFYSKNKSITLIQKEALSFFEENADSCDFPMINFKEFYFVHKHKDKKILFATKTLPTSVQDDLELLIDVKKDASSTSRTLKNQKVYYSEKMNGFLVEDPAFPEQLVHTFQSKNISISLFGTFLNHESLNYYVDALKSNDDGSFSLIDTHHFPKDFVPVVFYLINGSYFLYVHHRAKETNSFPIFNTAHNSLLLFSILNYPLSFTNATPYVLPSFADNMFSNGMDVSNENYFLSISKDIEQKKLPLTFQLTRPQVQVTIHSEKLYHENLHSFSIGDYVSFHMKGVSYFGKVLHINKNNKDEYVLSLFHDELNVVSVHKNFLCPLNLSAPSKKQVLLKYFDNTNFIHGNLVGEYGDYLLFESNLKLKRHHDLGFFKSRSFAWIKTPSLQFVDNIEDENFLFYVHKTALGKPENILLSSEETLSFEKAMPSINEQSNIAFKLISLYVPEIVRSVTLEIVLYLSISINGFENTINELTALLNKSPQKVNLLSDHWLNFIQNTIKKSQLFDI